MLQVCKSSRMRKIISTNQTPQRLAHFLDRPFFPWKKLIVGFSLAQFVFEGFLSLRQYQVLKHTKPPKVLASEVSQEVFDKSQVLHYIPNVHDGCSETNNTRHMDAQKQSSAPSLTSTAKFKTQPSSTTTFCPNYGP